MKISEFAQASGVGIETIRYYQRRGLLPVPPRHLGSFRRYPRAWVRDIRRIRGLQAMGFSLDEIHLLLHDPAPDCLTIQRMLEQHIEATRRELARLTDRLCHLQTAWRGFSDQAGRGQRHDLSYLLRLANEVGALHQDEQLTATAGVSDDGGCA